MSMRHDGGGRVILCSMHKTVFCVSVCLPSAQDEYINSCTMMASGREGVGGGGGEFVVYG